ncbi:putative S-adenosyl-L-methionine-dependent methyltransferase [Lyophyllum shimeji]|uniref:S-adenosyl-L-methionine-dependent methyltransferase n=1 Tax=Lyophyllum shimeji TaxID=47721 RepID=A0A9P3PPE7_LYOSH|nr:putative S-adenosyl-L-methionine-dependent methyltransferase [Lyophyllum shimeji]
MTITPSSSNGQVPALVALITNAAKVIEAHYSKSAKPFVPSLDDVTPHPLDSEMTSPGLREAVQILEGACAQLSATVARPNHTMLNRVMQIYEPGCLHVVLTFKIPDILQEKPLGMHISELSSKAGINEGKLGRILRLLASKHIFREVSKDVFANNRLSVQLLSSNPLSSIAMHFTDENNKAVTLLADVLADPDWGDSLAVEKTAWNKSSGYSGSLFRFFEGATPEGAKQGARFGLGMMGWGNAIEANAVINGFPWGGLAPGATVCDVGGGIGHITIQLAKAYPELRLKLQDLPDRIVQAETEVWPKECPEAIANQRIEFKAIDFLAEPPIEGCDVYYVRAFLNLTRLIYSLLARTIQLKNIMHDWPTKECIQILRNVRKALKPDSRVLIHEYVLAHADRKSADAGSAFTPAPEPLLPNYGVGRIRQYNLDLDMMVMLNSKERTLDEFIDIGEKSGLSFVKLWDLGEMGVVEFRRDCADGDN